MKKILSLTLLLVMLAGMLFSCQTPENGGNGTGTGDGGDVVAPNGDIDLEIKDEEGFTKDRIPEGDALKALGFEGSTVKILGWDDEEAESIPMGDSTSDPLKSKLYYHWRGIEERLSVTFQTTYTKGWFHERTTFFTAARADDAMYDLIMNESLFPITLAMEGRLCNLKKLGYPDLEMPWWPASVDQFTQHGALYFISSNSSAMGISNMNVVYVNDGMITAKGGASPVQSVLRGVWTVEEMTSISKLFAGAAENATEETRIYGMVVDHTSRPVAFYDAMNFKAIVNNADGVGELGYDEESELEAITKALNLFEDMVNGVEFKIWQDSQNDHYDELQEGRTAMQLGWMGFVRQLEKTEEYTVVPVPMLDLDQFDTVGYRTGHRDCTDLWCMPTTTANKVLSGIVLEANASGEYRNIGPFYYEQYLKDRYANGADGRKCFDILRDSVIYDFGRAMQVSAIGAEDYWRPCFWVGGNLKYGNVFAEKYRASSGERIQNLQKLLENYAKYKDN